MIKKKISIFFAVMMLLGLLSVPAFAEGEPEVPPPAEIEEASPAEEAPPAFDDPAPAGDTGEEMDFSEAEPSAEEDAAWEVAEPASADPAPVSTIAMPSGGVTMNITGAMEGLEEVSYYGTDGTFPAAKAWETDTFPTQYTGLLPGGQVGFWLKPEYRLTAEGAAVLYDDYFYDFLIAAVTDRKVDLQIPSGGTINVCIVRSGEQLPRKIPMTEYGREIDGAWLSANLEGGQMGTGWITSGAVIVMQLKSGYTVEVLQGGQVKNVGAYRYPTNVADSVGVTVKVDDDAEQFVYAVVKQGEHYQAPDQTPAAPQPEDSGVFCDVAEDSWCYSSVEQAYSSGIVKGVTENTFSPNGATTRGQTVTMLYRAMGSPGGSAVFSDTDGEVASAAGWAAGRGVVNGVSATAFAPDSSITREQLVTMLYRMAGSPAADDSVLAAYTDGDAVRDYARDAMAWAVAGGLLTGYGDDTVRPAATATRAEVCTLIMRCLG